MVSYKFSGYLNSNLFVRTEHKISVTQLWSRYLVPLIEEQFSDAGVRAIRGGGSWDECLKILILLGSVYLDQKRQTAVFDLDSHNVVRIHLMPKRYDTRLFQWGEHVVFENSEFLIVNKPAFLPVHPTLDNCTENILKIIQQKQTETIYCVHRLDLETTGLMIYAKGAKAMGYFQRLFSSRKGLRKFYKAMVDGTGPEEGFYQHWMLPGQGTPKKVVDIIDPDRTDAASIELTVQNRKGIQWQNRPVAIVDIELHTGRTHQIRAQMAHLGFPLVSDVLYGGPNLSTTFHLHSYRLHFIDQQGQIYEFNCDPFWN
ncbi:MAG: RluA family pseudouridine synthase [Bdellovibrionaceae bacterium]|nr:RluA family pseudouridine synthase [Pseudobdellovibrionaceae bacterium]